MTLPKLCCSINLANKSYSSVFFCTYQIGLAPRWELDPDNRKSDFPSQQDMLAGLSLPDVIISYNATRRTDDHICQILYVAGTTSQNRKNKQQQKNKETTNNDHSDFINWFSNSLTHFSCSISCNKKLLEIVQILNIPLYVEGGLPQCHEKSLCFSLKCRDKKSLNINWYFTSWQNYCLLSCVNILFSLSRSIHSLPTVPLRYTLILLILSKSIPTSATLGIRLPHTSTKK